MSETQREIKIGSLVKITHSPSVTKYMNRVGTLALVMGFGCDAAPPGLIVLIDDERLWFQNEELEFMS